MDLWDVVKLMVRRWYASVPMLLLTMIAVLWTGIHVSPNYTAEGNLMMLPPATEIVAEAGQERTVNPWSTDALSGAVVTRLRNRALAEQLKTEGYRASWEVGRDLEFYSVLAIKVTSPTADEAHAATERLLQVAEAEVRERQAPYRLTDGEKINTIRLGSGEIAEVARGNQMRALIVVLGAFGILTMGVTIAVDALMCWRARRTALPPARIWAVEPVSGGQGGAVPGNGGQPAAIDAPNAANGGGGEATVPAGIRVRYRAGVPVPVEPGDASAAGPVDAVAAPVPAPAPDVIPAQDPKPGDDTTIVLPLSNVGWERESREDQGAAGTSARAPHR